MQQSIRICPGCGAKIPETGTAFCAYCGRELLDLSREKTDQKIAEVTEKQTETTAVPKKLSLVIAATLCVLLLLFGLCIFFDVPDRIEAARLQGGMDRLSYNMQKAYENEDWDKLEQYLIYECEDYVGAPDYFLYRTAWFLHTYPPLFDEAYQTHDTEEMLWIYETLAKDYEMRGEPLYDIENSSADPSLPQANLAIERDSIFYQIYETDDAIEEALKEEVERETEILTEEGLEDEMYKLRF